MNKTTSVVLLIVLAAIVSYAWMYPFIGVGFLWWQWQGLVLAAFWFLVGFAAGNIIGK